MSANISLRQVPLDPSVLQLSEDESEFLKQQTGISDDEELRKHILKVQGEAWKVFPYRCIYSFHFLKLQMSRHSFYEEFLRIGKSQSGALYLEVACCFGNDVRKAIADGYPIENVVVSDLYEGFWEQGHSLYKSSPENFPVPFVQGDLLSPEFIHPRAPYSSSDQPLPPHPPLTGLASLTPLQGHLTFVHASLLFHLFDKAQQAFVAKSLASLLSPQSGSTIFGLHVAQPTAGTYTWEGVGDVYCHSPETWTELWDGEVFQRGSIRVHTKLKSLDSKAAAALGTGLKTLPLLEWSVTRT